VSGVARNPGERAQPRLVGLLVEFETPEALIEAARRVRDASFTRWDAHSPYPVHGLDAAAGIRPTKLPWLVFVCGVAGAGLALLMQWWMNAIDFPFAISGKPYFSLPADIPIMFELTVLVAAVGAVFGMLAFNGLPKLYNAVFSSARFKRATTDRFFISIDAVDPVFDAEQTGRFLESLGGVKVERLEDVSTARPPRWLVRGAVIAVLVALIPLGLAAGARASKSGSPRIHLIQDMDNQPKFRAQAADRMFADGRAMRLPSGATRSAPFGETVARGELHEDEHYYAGKVHGEWATVFPPRVKIDEQLLRRGQQRFGIYCSPCHGLSGHGNGPVATRAAQLEEPNWVAPTSLHDQQVRERPVGHIFNTITNGIRTMPRYGEQIPEADRWAIVAYVRALQRSTNARIEDVPVELRGELR